MNHDDRLFAVVGGSVVAAVTVLFIVSAGRISAPVEDREPLVVAPIRVAADPDPSPDVVVVSYEDETALPMDQVVRTLAGAISTHPRIAGWLVNDQILERFVFAVEAVADGYSPREQFDFLAPWKPFLVREDKGSLVIAAGTFRRYDLVVEVVSSIDAEAAVAIFRELEPAIFEVRKEVAWHRGDFEDRLRMAIDHLLDVEVPSGAIEVEQRAVAYAFANDDLERLTDAQRQLVRMGRGNATRVQQKLRDIRAAFGWPAADPVGIRHAVHRNQDEPLRDPVGERVFHNPLSLSEGAASDQPGSFRVVESDLGPMTVENEQERVAPLNAPAAPRAVVTEATVP
jgi:hypothetical protein